MARPRKEEKDKQEKMIGAHVTDEVYYRIKNIAQFNKVSIGEVIRRLVIEGLDGEMGFVDGETEEK